MARVSIVSIQTSIANISLGSSLAEGVGLGTDEKAIMAGWKWKVGRTVCKCLRSRKHKYSCSMGWGTWDDGLMGTGLLGYEGRKMWNNSQG